MGNIADVMSERPRDSRVEATKNSEIEEQMMQLNQAIQKMQENIQDISERFSPILAPASPQENSPDGRNIDIATTFAQRLFEYNLQLSELNKRIHLINQACEL